MIQYLFPDIYYNSVQEIDYNKLKQQGIKTLLFDIDNTLAPHDVKKPPKEILHLIKTLKDSGFSIGFISNNGFERVSSFSEDFKELGVIFVHKAGKPKNKALKKLVSDLNSTLEETALIGDQVFTDVWCAKLNKVYSVLIRPIGLSDEFTVKLKRKPEKLVLWLYKKVHTKEV